MLLHATIGRAGGWAAAGLLHRAFELILSWLPHAEAPKPRHGALASPLLLAKLLVCAGALGSPNKALCGTSNTEWLVDLQGLSKRLALPALTAAELVLLGPSA